MYKACQKYELLSKTHYIWLKRFAFDHLFYQWNPMQCAHGAKAWGHATSQDLFTWQHQPLALAPTEEFETHGCYSGSGLVVNNQLELFQF